METFKVDQSPSDKNFYRGLVLENGMKVLVVSDPEAEKSAVALSVQVGSFSDPPNLRGLAHYLEHMLFMGTKKYPVENAYMSFISNHAGSTNAFTSGDLTTYHHDIDPPAFKESLEIFSEFFKSPLFEQSSAEREILAVDSEFQIYIKNDDCRMYRCIEITSDQDQDFGKFKVGNIETLKDIPFKEGIDVREELLAFHKKFYSSNIMTMSLYSREDLDILSEWVIQIFGTIPNRQVSAPIWPQHPFTEDWLRLKVNVVPVMELRTLRIQFPAKDYRNYYKESPNLYVSNLIGHEGEGSLFSYLRSQGWATSLTAGLTECYRGFSIFTIEIELTPSGEEHMDDICAALFEYVDLLQKEGPQEWHFNELARIQEMWFRFAPKRKPLCYVLEYCNSLQECKKKDVITGPYLMERFDPILLREFVESLTPQKIRILYCSKSLEGKTNIKEHYFGVDYSVEKIPEDKIDEWRGVSRSQFYLPAPNKFIATQLCLVPKEQEFFEEPVLLVDEPSCRLWFSQARMFPLPQGEVKIQLCSTECFKSPLNSLMSDMIVSCFRDAHNEYFYAATLAGLKYSLSSSSDSVILCVEGFSETQHELLKDILERLVAFKICPDRFEALKEGVVRELRSFMAMQPSCIASYFEEHILAERSYTHDQRLAVIDQCTVEACQAFLPILFGKLYIQALVIGNFGFSEAIKIMNSVRSVLKHRPDSLENTKCLRVFELNKGIYFNYLWLDEGQPNNAVTAYYQLGAVDTLDPTLVAHTSLFGSLISEPAFDILRTKEQLGYNVYASSRVSSGTVGISFGVQSEKSTSHVLERIHCFAQEYIKDYLQELTTENFEKHRDALVASILEKPKSMGSLSRRYWHEIAGRTYNFHREEMNAAAVRKLNKEDIIKFYERRILDKLAVKELIVCVVGKDREAEVKLAMKEDLEKGTREVGSLDDFKVTHKLFEVQNAITSYKKCSQLSQKEAV